jgi:hypothetical protein
MVFRPPTHFTSDPAFRQALSIEREKFENRLLGPNNNFPAFFGTCEHASFTFELDAWSMCAKADFNN